MIRGGVFMLAVEGHRATMPTEFDQAMQNDTLASPEARSSREAGGFCFGGTRPRLAADGQKSRFLSLLEDLPRHLRDCDHPTSSMSDEFTHTLDPRGFWRVDKEKYLELRHAVLSLVEFGDFQRLGLEVFLNENEGEGWMLPATLRLHCIRTIAAPAAASSSPCVVWTEERTPNAAARDLMGAPISCNLFGNKITTRNRRAVRGQREGLRAKPNTICFKDL